MSKSRNVSATEELARDLGEFVENEAKIQLAHKASIAQDLRLLSQQERRNNQRHEDFLLTGRIPGPTKEEDMGGINIDSPTNHYPAKGIGTAGLIGVALASGLAPALLGGYLALRGTPAPVTIPPVPPITTPVPVLIDGHMVQTQKQADGTDKILWTLPAKLAPDGTAASSDGRKWRRFGDEWEEVK